MPGILTTKQIRRWRALLAHHLSLTPPSSDHTDPYFLWPALADDADLRALYEESGIGDAGRTFLRPDLAMPAPEVAQLALTLPPPAPPRAPHIDGLIPTEDDGRPGAFTILAGAQLTAYINASHGLPGPR